LAYRRHSGAQDSTSRRWSVFVGAALMVTLVATCTGPSALAASKSWIDYFPKDVGRSCRIELPSHSMRQGSSVITFSGGEQTKLLSIGRSSEGSLFTFRTTIHAKQADSVPSDNPGIAPISSTQIVEYLVLKDGQFEAPLENQIDLQGEFVYRGHVVYPSIASIASGKSEATHLSFSYAPSTPTGVADMEALTKGHGKILEGVVDYRVSGLLRDSLHTPNGTFHGVVGLDVDPIGFTVLNAVNTSTASTLAADFEKSASAETTTIWYAPGLGSVSVWQRATSGKTVVADAHCTN